MALDEALGALLERIRAERAPVVDVWNVPGPPRDQVAQRLREWCGHAPDELVTWFSTMNGATPVGSRMPRGSELVCRWHALTLADVIDASVVFSAGAGGWPRSYLQIVRMDPDSLYVDAAADPVVTPVYRWNPNDDLRPMGFRLADSLEELVGLWLELFDHGLFYDHERLLWAVTDAVAGVSLSVMLSAWTASESAARRGLEEAAANDDPNWRRP